ncbi:MAG TPA: hypothetical protein VLX44_11435 [Xanthobacteraceae bacterium]|nr:hypothetical protein [Xanthobacteraceae bacterium]
MIRSICGGLALAVCSMSVLSGAPRQDDQSSLPMRFALHQESPADGCGTTCRRLVAASGMITADTPRDFEAFVHSHDVRGATVVLDSKGGSVLGAIALGRVIRGLGLSTTVGRIREQVGREATSRRVRVWPRAECQSMCPFVLLGGVNRSVPPEARVLVHQIWLGDRRDDATAASYTAEDLVLVQHDIGKLMQYTMDMGGGAELLEVALRIPPWEPMRMLSRDELKRTRLDNSQDRTGDRVAQAPATLASAGTGALATSPPASDGARNAFEGARGWVMTERPGGSALVRRHPLTIEGEEIGDFEIALGCGRTVDSYTVNYRETRRAGDEHDNAPVKHVDLWIEGKMAALDVASSELDAQGDAPAGVQPISQAGAAARALETRASGSVTAEALKSFADATSDSITVRTVSALTPGTLIRIGNIGFAAGFRKLAAACETLPPATEAHAELAPARADDRGR